MKIKKLDTLFFIPLMFLCSCTNANYNPSESNDSSTIPPSSDSTNANNNPSESNDSNTIPPSSDSTNTSSFDALSLTLDSGQKFNYYLYTPKNATENIPLVLYLHGGSGKPESEEGNLNLLTDGDGLPKFVKEGQVLPHSYIVFPQLPYEKKGWSDVKNDLFSFLNKVSCELKCNKERVSITGHSMGGKGTWDITLSYPDTFYKVAPLSGNVTLNDANLNKLKNKPVWAFVGTNDTIVDPQSSIEFINALSKTNFKAKITIIEGYAHFDVPNVYLSNEYNLLNWLVD